MRNLLLGCTTLSEIHAGAPGMPRSLLNQRMRQLEHAGIVQRRAKPAGRGWLYELTPAGRDLAPVCDALGVWGAKWLEAAPTELDPFIVLWAICRSITPERTPTHRLVVRLNFRDAPHHPFWLVLQHPESEVCCKPPGYDEDLVLTTDTEWLAKWYMGRITLGHAIHAGVITIDGPSQLIREFSRLDGVGSFSAIAPAYDPRLPPVEVSRSPIPARQTR